MRWVVRRTCEACAWPCKRDVQAERWRAAEGWMGRQHTLTLDDGTAVPGLDMTRMPSGMRHQAASHVASIFEADDL